MVAEKNKSNKNTMSALGAADAVTNLLVEGDDRYVDLDSPDVRFPSSFLVSSRDFFEVLVVSPRTVWLFCAPPSRCSEGIPLLSIARIHSMVSNVR